MSCSGIGLPAAQEVHDTADSVNHASDVEFARSNIAKLNPEQKNLVTTILSSVEASMKDDTPHECRAFFLDGPGGTGKTMVYNTLMAALRADGLKVRYYFRYLLDKRLLHAYSKTCLPSRTYGVCDISNLSSLNNVPEGRYNRSLLTENN